MKRKSRTRVDWKKALLITLASIFILIGLALVWASTIKLPDISTFEARKIANSSKITDRTGEVVLYDIHRSVRRTEIPLNEMGENIKTAIVSVEDWQFYNHKGIRLTSIARAILKDIRHGSFKEGGSTITQQIVKNTLLNTDKTPTRKFKEWILALKLERHFTKDEILQIYLNDAPYGGTIYGVEEASRAFFNKSSKDLTLGEAAYLAALPEAPTYLSPFGKNKARLDERKNFVLRRMKEVGVITDAQYEEARNEMVEFNATASNSLKAPHFVFYVLDYLEEKYGRDVMESGGYTIKTTLDYELQEKAEDIVEEYAKQNEKRYRASNASLVTIDPTTGQILTMVGSRNYFDKAVDGAFNIATAKRQPGSAFKPFVYLTAFAKGYTPETILFDVPTQFSTTCGSAPDSCYSPNNFDDKFKGPLSLRSALAESRNVPSVKLLYLVGIEDAIATAHSLGITTLNTRSDYGLSLVLGGGEVTLLDMTSAYGVMANSGLRNPTTGILEVRDRKGNIVEQFEPDGVQTVDKNSALIVSDILSDSEARMPTFGNNITIPGVAVKTGTTNDERDAWIVGYTPNLVVGVWSGNNNNSSMTSGGSAVSGPLWKAFMQHVLEKNPQIPFEKPVRDPDFENLKPVLRGEWKGNSSIVIDATTGMRATDATPPEYRIEKFITNVQDILYWVDKKDPRGKPPTNPNSDPQFKLWNPPVQQWWYNNGGRSELQPNPSSPNSGEQTIYISGLPSQMNASDSVNISIGSSGENTLASVDLFVNDNFLTTINSPFSFSFTPSQYGYGAGTYQFSAVGTTSTGSKHSAQAVFTVN